MIRKLALLGVTLAVATGSAVWAANENPGAPAWPGDAEWVLRHQTNELYTPGHGSYPFRYADYGRYEAQHWCKSYAWHSGVYCGDHTGKPYKSSDEPVVHQRGFYDYYGAPGAK
jgi:hypothetical protein